jgi:cytoskeletal protein CcmA (bactofilin family)
VRLAKELVVRGEIEAAGDLTVEGRVEGRINASEGLVIEPSAVIEADVRAARVQVSGRVRGRISAGESVRIDAAAEVVGDVAAPQISVADGAVIRGRIEMAVDLPEALR